MRWRHAASIGTLLNKRDQSGLMMRDAAVFVSLLSIPENIGRGLMPWLGPVAQVVRAHP
jgi:hypothetical protein